MLMYSLAHLSPDRDYNLYCYGFPKHAEQQGDVRQPLLTAHTATGMMNDEMMNEEDEW